MLLILVCFDFAAVWLLTLCLGCFSVVFGLLCLWVVILLWVWLVVFCWYLALD